jgi:hypothetical protein
MAADDVLVVNGGREMVVDALLALGATAPAWIQWGVGSTAVDPTQVDLVDKTGCDEARVEGVDSKVSTYTYRVVGTITKATAAAIIREVATFNGAGIGAPPAGDTMFLRAMFDAISLNVGNAIEFTIDTLVTAT